MKKIFSSALYIAVAICMIGCAKTTTQGPNEAYKRYFDAWMEINHPGLQPQGLGYYVIDEKPGTGTEVEDDGFVPKIKTVPRVGIDYAGEFWRDIEWRFISDN